MKASNSAYGLILGLAGMFGLMVLGFKWGAVAQHAPTKVAKVSHSAGSVYAAGSPASGGDKDSAFGGASSSTLHASPASLSASFKPLTFADADEARDFEFRAQRSVIVAKALHGDATLFGQYVAYSHKCRGLPVEIAETESDCSPATVTANDARFVSIAERLAKGGDAAAQLALGQYWLSIASRLLSSHAAAGGEGEPGRASEPDAADSVGSQFKSPEFVVMAQRAANWLAQAAAKDSDAIPQLAFLQSIGVHPIGGQK